MRKIIGSATAIFVSMFMYSCAIGPDAATASIIAKANSAHVMKDILAKLPRQFPELKEVGIMDGKPSVMDTPTVWQGEEYASITLSLKDKTRFHPADMFPKVASVPIIDVQVQFARYSSPADAQQALEKNLVLRPGMTPPVQNYKGARVFKFTSGPGNIVCQFQQYIIEIMPGRDDIASLSLKILDSILAELSSTAAESE